MPPLALSATDPASWVAGQTVRPETAAADQRIAQASGRLNQAGAREAKAKEAGQQFEALYLRQMFEASLPKNSDELFGEGTSGTMWRSMLADSLATTLSKSGTIGLAQMITARAQQTKGK